MISQFAVMLASIIASKVFMFDIQPQRKLFMHNNSIGSQ